MIRGRTEYLQTTPLNLRGADLSTYIVSFLKNRLGAVGIDAVPATNGSRVAFTIRLPFDGVRQMSERNR